eukprot:6478863-Amphidinium_carterae.1
MVRRLQFLRRLLISDNGLVKGMLMIHGHHGFWEQWLLDLNLVRERVPRLNNLPIATPSSLPTWITYIIVAENEWTSLLKKHFLQIPHTEILKAFRLPSSFIDDLAAVDRNNVNEMPEHPVHDDHDEHLHPPQPQQELREIHQDPVPVPAPDRLEGSHHCPFCDKTFQQWRSLSLHRRRAHGVVSGIALRAYGTQCTVCNAQLKTRALLIEHLNRRAVCGIHTLHFVQPMTMKQYHDNIARLRSLEAGLSRSAAPRTGPIPLVEGIPRSQSVAPINPFNHLFTTITDDPHIPDITNHHNNDIDHHPDM